MQNNQTGKYVVVYAYTYVDIDIYMLICRFIFMFLLFTRMHMHACLWDEVLRTSDRGFIGFLLG